MANILTFGNICKVLNEKLQGVQLFAGYETGNSRFLSRILCVVMVSFIFVGFMLFTAQRYIVCFNDASKKLPQALRKLIFCQTAEFH